MYFTKIVSSNPRSIHQFTSTNWTPTRKLVFAAILAALAAILQSAGGYLPVIGFLISPFATIPIILSVVISLRYGSFSYLLAIVLLLLIEPSELFIFPFTTGLLGLGLGWGFRILSQRWTMIIINGCILFIGICIPLYILKFPVFGPFATTFQMEVLLIILGFSVIYGWLWLELSLFLLRRLKTILLLSE